MNINIQSTLWMLFLIFIGNAFAILYAYAPLDIIPFYWRFFGEGLMIVGIAYGALSLMWMSKKKTLLYLCFAFVCIGLLIYIIAPKQFSPEVPEGVINLQMEKINGQYLS